MIPKELAIDAGQAKELVAAAEALTPVEISALQRERLELLLTYAREHSPYLKEKYADLPYRPKLEDLPVTHRDEAMANFADWVCDREITSAGVNAYISDLANAEEPFLGKYTVLTTSGTTGVPLKMIRDSRHNNVNAALMSLRFYGGSKLGEVAALEKPFVRIAGILTMGGYHSTYLSFLRSQHAYEAAGHGGDILGLDVGVPTSEMVEQLNAFQPEMLTGYPSNIQVLARQQQEGHLSIHPQAIACSAEHLSAEARELIEETFGCPVMNNYCSTEGGELAMLCVENKMHINDDWMIVEPVDDDLSPVADGVESTGILLTNLANLVQPIIRYYISDRVILERGCPCGLPFPYLAIEGRKEDLLTFNDEDGNAIPLPSVPFISISMHLAGCYDAQFIKRDEKTMEIRYTTVTAAERPAVGDGLLAFARETLHHEGLAGVSLLLSQEPLIIGKTGKVRNLIDLSADTAK